MHELSVCQALIGEVEKLAREQDTVHVLSVVVGVGQLSGVEPALLQQAYPLAAAGTVAQDSELIIEQRPIRIHCPRCDKESEAVANNLVCAFCGDWRTTLVGGDELLLMQIEFEREKAYV